MKKSAEDILTLLRAHPEGVTAFTALQEARCLRLAARVSDLKAEGFHITTDMIPVGHDKRVALYRLHERPHVLTLEEVEQREAWTPEELLTIASQSGIEVRSA